MKRRIFLDTNIVIDYLSKREPYAADALAVFSLSPRQNQLCISALSFTTIFYVLRKHFEREMLLNMLEDLHSLIEVLPTDENIISLAIHSNFHDFEDAVQYYTALAGNSDVIVTRNPKDFTKSIIPIYTPSELLGIPYWYNDDSDKTQVNEPSAEYQK